MKRIRAAARTYGLTIRTGRATRGSAERVYRVLDAATGETLGSKVPDLDKLAVQLWWIIKQRREPERARGAAEVVREACPNCGTVRVGSFRFCRSCGMDFEPSRPSEPDVATPTEVAAPVAEPTNATNGSTPDVDAMDWSAAAPSSSERPILGRLPVAADSSSTNRVGAESSPEYVSDPTEVRRALAGSSMTAQRILQASRPNELVFREASKRRRFDDPPVGPIALGDPVRVRRIRSLIPILVAAVIGLVVGGFVGATLLAPH